MKLWGGESDSGCCSVSDVDDARRVADQLGIDHHVFNFGDDFDERVVQPYVDAHASGVTPNPCIECNRHLKFDRLLRRADALGFTTVATGHHARIVPIDGTVRRVARGADPLKDQSYVLYMLRQPQLARVALPIGDIDKAAVRSIATRLGLRTATKPDSQDVCFITAVGGREKFLSARIPLRQGRIVDSEGTELGRVPAVELVTIGQRKGLDLAGAERRRFVIDVDMASATVVVGCGRIHQRHSAGLSIIACATAASSGMPGWSVTNTSRARRGQASADPARSGNVLDARRLPPRTPRCGPNDRSIHSTSSDLQHQNRSGSSEEFGPRPARHGM